MMTLKVALLAVTIAGLFCADEPSLISAPSSFEVNASVEDTNASFKAVITNRGSASIIIKDIRGGCGCIKTEIDTRLLAPQATANLDVVFEFKDYSGPQNRKIRIVYSPENATEPKDELSAYIPISGTIPTGLTFSSKAIAWMHMDKPDMKSIEIQYSEDVDGESVHVEALDSNPHLTVTSSNSVEKRKLTVEITPKTTNVDEISPSEGKELQQPYVVRYTTKLKKTVRYERFFTAILKRPGKDDVPKTAPADKPNYGLIGTWQFTNASDESTYRLVLQHGLTFSLSKVLKEGSTEQPFGCTGTFAFYGETKALVLSPARSATDKTDPPTIVLKYLVANKKESLTGEVNGATVVLAKP